MKGIFPIIGLILIGIIFIPLALIIFFGFPLEFIVSSWHNLRIDSSTQGLITHSETIHGRHGTKGSSITYTYSIHGKTYESSRWRAGLMSNSSTETNGGGFATHHPVGTTVTVYYDASVPEFSLLELGWPKWSLGFSLAAWGIVFANRFRRTAPRSTQLFICYPLSRGLLFTGFLTLFLLPTTLNADSFKIMLLGFVSISIMAFVWLILCPSRKITAD